MKMLLNRICRERIGTALELMNSVDYLLSLFFEYGHFLVAGDYKTSFSFLNNQCSLRNI